MKVHSHPLSLSIAFLSASIVITTHAFKPRPSRSRGFGNVQTRREMGYLDDLTHNTTPDDNGPQQIWMRWKHPGKENVGCSNRVNDSSTSVQNSAVNKMDETRTENVNKEVPSYSLAFVLQPKLQYMSAQANDTIHKESAAPTAVLSRPDDVASHGSSLFNNTGAYLANMTGSTGGRNSLSKSLSSNDSGEDGIFDSLVDNLSAQYLEYQELMTKSTVEAVPVTNADNNSHVTDTAETPSTPSSSATTHYTSYIENLSGTASAPEKILSYKERMKLGLVVPDSRGKTELGTYVDHMPKSNSDISSNETSITSDETSQTDIERTDETEVSEAFARAKSAANKLRLKTEKVRSAANSKTRTRKEKIEPEKAEQSEVAAEIVKSERILAARERAEQERLAAEETRAQEIADKMAIERAKAAVFVAVKGAAKARISKIKSEEQKLMATLKKAELERLAAEKAEAERIAVAKREEEARIAAEKKAAELKLMAAEIIILEEKRIAAEKDKERRVAATKKARDKRIAAEKEAAEKKRIAADKEKAKKLAAKKEMK
mmetsp:Transcript_57895/g.69047  ORF Transcript_57895/g.69047 Transcript_57895/m.69047 type:complete len:548 (-) Transcript_57895:1163-2806(-)